MSRSETLVSRRKPTAETCLQHDWWRVPGASDSILHSVLSWLGYRT